MMNNCPVCNRRHIITWPEFWPYRRKDLLFCSDQCVDVFDVKVLHKLNGKALPERKKGKKKMSYTKTKKDGTPAKKSGPKPKQIEVPANEIIKAAMEHPERPIVSVEEPVVMEKIETPEKTTDMELKKPLEKIKGPCHIDKFLITSIRHPELGEFYYDKKNKCIDWRTDGGDEISLSATGCETLLKDLPHIMRILGVNV